MDLAVAFVSMFLLAFGLAALGLGLFTMYFGAGKSRIIGVILGLIGLVVLVIFYLLTIDHFGHGWLSEDVSDSFMGVLGITIGGIASFGLIICLMMFIKEPEPEIPGLEDWEKELSEMEDKPGDGDKEDKPADGEPEGIPGDADKEDTPDSPDAEEGMQDEIPSPEEIPEPETPDDGDSVDETKADEEPQVDDEPKDEMSEFLREKEENKIVKEDWEKVEDEPSPEDDAGESEPSEEPVESGPAEEEIPEEPEPTDPEPPFPSEEEIPEEPPAPVEEEIPDEPELSEEEPPAPAEEEIEKKEGE
jgi:hypothetical protein